MQSLCPGAQSWGSSGSHTASTAGGQAAAPHGPPSSYGTQEGPVSPSAPAPGSGTQRPRGKHRQWQERTETGARAAPPPHLARWLAPWARGSGPRLGRVRSWLRGCMLGPAVSFTSPRHSHAPRLPCSGVARQGPPSHRGSEHSGAGGRLQGQWWRAGHSGHGHRPKGLTSSCCSCTWASLSLRLWSPCFSSATTASHLSARAFLSSISCNQGLGLQLLP